MTDVPLPPDAEALVRRCPAFADLTSDAAAELVRRMRGRAWKAGDTIIRQGDPGEWMALVAEGTTRVEVSEPAGAHRVVCRIGEAELVGEMALLTRQARLADVVAETDVLALVIPAADFDDIAVEHPELGAVLTHLVAARLGEGELDGLSGKAVDRYRIVRCAGRGGMSIVYEAVDAQTGARVALKMMSHRLIYEKGALARFQREADILETIDHPNIARVFGRFRAFRTYFIAMEYCDGPTLEQTLARTGPFPEPAARRAVAQLAGALRCLHARGVVHRDLKPANVLVTSGASGPPGPSIPSGPDGSHVMKLADFGLAKQTVGAQITAVTEARTLLGTPWYMSPEALSGDDPGPSGDTYALGCVLYELLTARRAFSQTTYGELLEAKRRFTLPPAGAPVAPAPRASAPAPGITLPPLAADTRAFLAAALSPDPAVRSTADLAAVERW
ncbi:MAG: Serine/threonine-protein kinase PknD [Planctomycetes bacterium]|nr:Serine/threonine-protein kinase PknD [Planctomycetota bacterium]